MQPSLDDDALVLKLVIIIIVKPADSGVGCAAETLKQPTVEHRHIII